MQTPNRRKGGKLARLAAHFCRQPEFQAFCCAEDEEGARRFILDTCRIRSRAQLDHDVGAAQLFHELVRRPFVEWQGKR